jgi:hypothetical protein
LTPKAPSFTRAEFEENIYDRSSGIGYEGPLVKKMSKVNNNEELLNELEEND